jgi:hypothetical protein
MSIATILCYLDKDRERMKNEWTRLALYRQGDGEAESG